MGLLNHVYGDVDPQRGSLCHNRKKMLDVILNDLRGLFKGNCNATKGMGQRETQGTDEK